MAKVTKIDFHSSAFIEDKWRTMEWRTIFLQVKECKLTSNINVMVMPQVHSVESMQSLYNWHELSQNAHSHNQNNLNKFDMWLSAILSSKSQHPFWRREALQSLQQKNNILWHITPYLCYQQDNSTIPNRSHVQQHNTMRHFYSTHTG